MDGVVAESAPTRKRLADEAVTGDAKRNSGAESIDSGVSTHLSTTADAASAIGVDTSKTATLGSAILFKTLPADVLWLIARRLRRHDVKAFGLVCKPFWRLIHKKYTHQCVSITVDDSLVEKLARILAFCAVYDSIRTHELRVRVAEFTPRTSHLHVTLISHILTVFSDYVTLRIWPLTAPALQYFRKKDEAERLDLPFHEKLRVVDCSLFPMWINASKYPAHPAIWNEFPVVLSSQFSRDNNDLTEMLLRGYLYEVPAHSKTFCALGMLSNGWLPRALRYLTESRFKYNRLIVAGYHSNLAAFGQCGAVDVSNIKTIHLVDPPCVVPGERLFQTGSMKSFLRMWNRYGSVDTRLYVPCVCYQELLHEFGLTTYDEKFEKFAAEFIHSYRVQWCVSVSFVDRLFENRISDSEALVFIKHASYCCPMLRNEALDYTVRSFAKHEYREILNRVCMVLDDKMRIAASSFLTKAYERAFDRFLSLF